MSIFVKYNLSLRKFIANEFKLVSIRKNPLKVMRIQIT